MSSFSLKVSLYLVNIYCVSLFVNCTSLFFSYVPIVLLYVRTFFSLINTTKLFDLVSFVISRIFCILHNISCISCFCDFSCYAFLAATKSHCLPSREPNQLDLSDLFLWFSLLCISYNFCQRGCGCVDVDEWMWMSGCSPLTTSHRRSSIRTIHEARPFTALRQHHH